MILRTEDEIRAAGAAAVAGWTPKPQQVDAIAALLAPVQDVAYGPLDQPARDSVQAAA
jgi:hypothetical protein